MLIFSVFLFSVLTTNKSLSDSCSLKRFAFLTTLESIYDVNRLNLTEYQNEIQDIMDQKEILGLRATELPFSLDLENQVSKSDDFAVSNPSEVVNSRLKAEYDLSIWNEKLRKEVIATDIKILDFNIRLKEQDEKYNLFKILLDIVYTKSLIKIYEDRIIIILRNIENFSLRRELGENTIKEELQAREEFLKAKNKLTSSEVRLVGFVDELETSLEEIEDKLPEKLYLDLKTFKVFACEKQSVELKKLKAEKERAELNLKLQKNTRLPQFTAFSSIDYDWSDQDDPASGRIGFNLNIPIFKGKQTSRKIIDAQTKIESIDRKILRISSDLKTELIRRTDIEEIFQLNLESFQKEIDNRLNSLTELREREALGQTVFNDIYATQSEISLLSEAKAGILKEFFETYLLTLQKFGSL